METRPKLALLANPLSGYNRRHGDAVAGLAAKAGIAYREGKNRGEMQVALRELADSAPDILIVNGGDGTVRAVATALRKATWFEKEPVLALLRGGSTNMIQNDAGLPGKPLQALERLLTAVRHGVPQQCLRQRSPLRVRHQGDDLDEYGFFWSAGALPRVLRLAQDGYAKGRARGPLGEFTALLGALRPLLFGDPANDSRLYPEAIDWHQGAGGFEATGAMETKRMFVMITTLDRLILGFSPGSQGTALKLVCLKYPYARKDLLSYLLSRGRNPDRVRDAFETEAAEELVLRVASDWVLDGEFFTADPADPLLHMSVAAPLQFLTC